MLSRYQLLLQIAATAIPAGVAILQEPGSRTERLSMEARASALLERADTLFLTARTLLIELSP